MIKYMRINKDNIIQGIFIAIAGIIVGSVIAALLLGSAVAFVEALVNLTVFTIVLVILTSLIFALMKWLERTE